MHPRIGVINEEEEYMRKALIAVLAIAMLVSAGAAMAAKTGQAKPWVYNPDKIANAAVSTWTKDGLRLEKNVATEVWAAAGADIKGVAGETLNNISFEVKGYCGAGAPRFNVYDDANTLRYLGCAHGTKTAIDADWTRVVFSGVEAGGEGALGKVLSSLEIAMDEQGQTTLRNISVNGVTITK